MFIGDCRAWLPTLPAESVHCCVTSPPYWMLRSYLDEADPSKASEIGQEPTPEQYVETLVGVFREVRRVLRADGTLWLDIGDTYCSNGGHSDKSCNDRRGAYRIGTRPEHEHRKGRARSLGGLKNKDLVGIPWRVAFALQADGWTLRSDVVWAKPNPMPESVTDRPTKSHEYLFMFSKARWVGPERGRYAHINDADAAWLALLFDTEGSLILRRESPRDGDSGSHSAQVSVGNTSRGLLERAAAIVGAGSVLERNGGQNAQMYHWQMSNKPARDLLLRLYPFFIVKQQQARCLIHLESRKEVRGGHERLSDMELAYRDRLWDAVKSLNHFGAPDLSWVPEPSFGHWDSQRYWYDADAIKDTAVTSAIHAEHGVNLKAKRAGEIPRVSSTRKDLRSDVESRHRSSIVGGQSLQDHPDGARNARSVWTIATEPYSGAHFATMPTALVSRCIMAGCPLGGTVLDPFLGSGTVGQVAESLGRKWIGCELNPQYEPLIRERTKQTGLPYSPPSERSVG